MLLWVKEFILNRFNYVLILKPSSYFLNVVCQNKLISCCLTIKGFPNAPYLLYMKYVVFSYMNESPKPFGWNVFHFRDIHGKHDVIGISRLCPRDVIGVLFKSVSMETYKTFRMDCIQSRWLIAITMAAVWLAWLMEVWLLKKWNRTHAKKRCAKGLQKHQGYSWLSNTYIALQWTEWSLWCPIRKTDWRRSEEAMRRREYAKNEVKRREDAKKREAKNEAEKKRSEEAKNEDVKKRINEAKIRREERKCEDKKKRCEDKKFKL